MASLMKSKHVATTPDERAIERGFSASVGLLGGLAFSMATVLTLGATSSVAGAIALLFLSATPLGIIVANKTLTTKASDRPVLEMMRYSAVTLPIIMMTELLLGGHSLGLLGDFVGSLAMFGPRFVMSLIVAGFAHALACRVVWDDEDRAQEARPNVDWQARYVEARARLASTTVDLNRRRQAEEDALAAFDRKLAQMSGSESDEWVLSADATCEAEAEEAAPIYETA